nr:asparaginase [Sulfitobacter sp. HI0129]
MCDDTGEIVEAWGDPSRVVLPRSSAKMIQALACDGFGAGTILRQAGAMEAYFPAHFSSKASSSASAISVLGAL